MQGGPAWSGASNSIEGRPGIVRGRMGCGRAGGRSHFRSPGRAAKSTQIRVRVRVSSEALRLPGEPPALPAPPLPPPVFGERCPRGAHTGARRRAGRQMQAVGVLGWPSMVAVCSLGSLVWRSQQSRQPWVLMALRVRA
ncbi:hypothetical protein P7K49_033624 [Saguinus oedipus]|uniref:Uncharacterized protein n=1 Tax=Saguinus oedipus TaxID=9490 RepID=A0ABQ9TSG8_SAGOE|nr:hypothetical protein P7K49_033624 [Saguinus oedipus]